MKLQVASKHTETCELCAWIHCVFTRPDASQKLRGKLERFTRKKGFSSPNHRLSGHGNSGCAHLALLNTYHRINWTFREGKPHLSSVLLGWPECCSSCVKLSTKTSRSFKYLHTTREVLKLWALWQKTRSFCKSSHPQTSLLITLTKKQFMCVSSSRRTSPSHATNHPKIYVHFTHFSYKCVQGW